MPTERLCTRCRAAPATHIVLTGLFDRTRVVTSVDADGFPALMLWSGRPLPASWLQAVRVPYYCGVCAEMPWPRLRPASDLGENACS